MDPLGALPHEVWTSIITEVASYVDARFSMDHIISQDVLLDLSHVSNYWKVLISSNAVLWTDIVLEDRYDAAVKAAIAFHYSQTAPLSLYLSAPIGWWDVLREDLIRNKGRVNKLFLCSDTETTLHPIIKELVPLDNLESIIYGTHDQFGEARVQREDILSCLSASPIKRVFGLSLRNSTLRQLHIDQLRTIRLSEDIDAVADILERLQYLRKIDFWVIPTNRDKPSAAHITRISDSVSKPLHWRVLGYFFGEPQYLLTIMGRLVDLVDIRIETKQTVFIALISLIRGLKKLASVELRITGAWPNFDPPPGLQTSHSVRELTIDFDTVDIPDNQRLTTNQRLGHIIPQCFPEVRHLHFSDEAHSIMPLFMPFDGFQYVNNLDIVKYRPNMDYTKEAAKPLPPTVERLTYSPDGAYFGSFPFYSSSTKYLEIEAFSPADMDMHNPAWPALHSLVVSSCVALTWKCPAFRSLWYISLGDRFATEAKNSAKLCQQIATHPNYFPVLRKLRLEVCPEWDILLILLESRLATTYHGISPISTLEIPSRCPPFLVEYFRDIIKGNHAKRIDYYSLSVASAYEIVQDVSIPGCAECHRALRFCNYFTQMMTGVVLAGPLEYPDDPLEILQSWETRAEKWYHVEGLLRWRACNKSFPLVSLSE